MGMFFNELVNKTKHHVQQYLFSLRNSDLDYKQIIQLSTVMIFSLAGFGIITPILPLIQSWGGVSAAQIGLYVSSFALARLIANVPAGIFIDTGFASIMNALLFAVLALIALVIASEGYLFKEVSIVERVILIIAAALLLFPEFYSSIIGAVVVAAFLLYCYLAQRKLSRRVGLSREN